MSERNAISMTTLAGVRAGFMRVGIIDATFGPFSSDFLDQFLIGRRFQPPFGNGDQSLWLRMARSPSWVSLD